MQIIKTDSFALSILTKGDPNSNRLALILPGRLDSKNYGNFVSHAEHLAGYGFFAVAFDPPGTWESPGDSTLYTTTNYLRAIDEVIKHFGNRPTLLLGHSRGAAAAILASMNNPYVIGIVPIMPNLGAPTAPSEADVQRGFRVEHRDMPPGTTKTIEQYEFKLPIAYWTDGKQYNPAVVLKGCIKPKLIICGDEDEFTPIDTVRRLFDELPQPKRLCEVHSGHDYRYRGDVIEQVNREIGVFIEEQLK